MPLAAIPMMRHQCCRPDVRGPGAGRRLLQRPEPARYPRATAGGAERVPETYTVVFLPLCETIAFTISCQLCPKSMLNSCLRVVCYDLLTQIVILLHITIASYRSEYVSQLYPVRKQFPPYTSKLISIELVRASQPCCPR